MADQMEKKSWNNKLVPQVVKQQNRNCSMDIKNKELTSVCNYIDYWVIKIIKVLSASDGLTKLKFCIVRCISPAAIVDDQCLAEEMIITLLTVGMEQKKLRV